MPTVDLHAESRLKYQADDRRFVSFVFRSKGKGLDVKLHELNREDTYDVLDCPRYDEPHEELLQAIQAFRPVVLYVQNLSGVDEKEIDITGISISYAKSGFRTITIKFKRLMQDDHWHTEKPRPVAEPPADLPEDSKSVYFPKKQLPLLDNLKFEILTYVDGTKGMAVRASKRTEDEYRMEEAS